MISITPQKISRMITNVVGVSDFYHTLGEKSI